MVSWVKENRLVLILCVVVLVLLAVCVAGYNWAQSSLVRERLAGQVSKAKVEADLLTAHGALVAQEASTKEVEVKLAKTLQDYTLLGKRLAEIQATSGGSVTHVETATTGPTPILPPEENHWDGGSCSVTDNSCVLWSKDSVETRLAQATFTSGETSALLGEVQLWRHPFDGSKPIKLASAELSIPLSSYVSDAQKAQEEAKEKALALSPHSFAVGLSASVSTFSSGVGVVFSPPPKRVGKFDLETIVSVEYRHDFDREKYSAGSSKYYEGRIIGMVRF